MGTLIDDGPLDYWSDEVPASRGQIAAIAGASCRLLDVPFPRTRLEASLLLVRLRLAEIERPKPAGGGEF